MAAVYQASGKLDKALPLFEETLKLRKAKLSPDSARIPDALNRLTELYAATKKPDEVKKWQAERAKYPEAKNAAAKEKK